MPLSQNTSSTMSPLFVLLAVLLTATSSIATETGSDIVTEILAALDGVEEMGRVTGYLQSSHADLVKELPLEAHGHKLSYTFFAPTSMAFMMRIPQDTVDPLVVDDNLRLTVLLRHFARQRVSYDDLAKLDTLVMADSKEAYLTRTADTQANLINKAEIQPGAIQLKYNIGTVYTVDQVFVESDEVGQAIKEHFERNPYTGNFFG